MEILHRSEAEQIDDPERADLLEIASREALDLTNLVDVLLVIERADADKLSVTEVRVSLRGQIAQVHEGLGFARHIVVEGPETFATADLLSCAGPRRTL